MSATFWDRGIELVPYTTGAVEVMDATDVETIAEAVGLSLPFGSVLDVGCGTGRIARLCQQYQGCDISADAVAYATRAGLSASVITGPGDLPGGSFHLITCLSVFTHISPAERGAYLDAFAARTSTLLVDILPGPDDGDVSAWTMPPEAFALLLEDCGWDVVGEHQKTSAQSFTHRYYHAVKR